MAPNRSQQVQLNFSGMGCWLTLAIGVGLITTVGIGWLLKSLLVLVVLLVTLPVLVIVGAQFWLKRNLVEGPCPSCSQPLTGFKSMSLSCPSCGVALQVQNGSFVRATSEGIIDVDVVDVEAADASDDVKTVDVEILPPADS